MKQIKILKSKSEIDYFFIKKYVPVHEYDSALIELEEIKDKYNMNIENIGGVLLK